MPAKNSCVTEILNVILTSKKKYHKFEHTNILKEFLKAILKHAIGLVFRKNSSITLKRVFGKKKSDKKFETIFC